MNLALLAERDLRERGVRARLWFEERTYSNLELHEVSLRLAGVLSALGVRRDERVMLLLPNCPEVLSALLAIWRVGAIAVPALPEQLEHVMRDAAPKLILTTLEQLPRLGPGSALTLVVTEGRGEPPAPALSYERALAHADPFELIATRAGEDPAVWLYTSGPPERPQGVPRSHRELRLQYRSRRDDVSLFALPWAHPFGLGVLLGSYLRGARTILVRQFEPELALRLLERHRVTVMAGVPAMFTAMLRVAEPYDTRSVQRWLVGAAPMPEPQRAAFEARFGGVMRPL